MQLGFLPGRSFLVRGPDSRFLYYEMQENTDSITWQPNLSGREEGTGHPTIKTLYLNPPDPSLRQTCN